MKRGFFCFVGYLLWLIPKGYRRIILNTDSAAAHVEDAWPQHRFNQRAFSNFVGSEDADVWRMLWTCLIVLDWFDEFLAKGGCMFAKLIAVSYSEL
ncbi:hypothetical protein HA466_0006280 [Hirschfeldia incana]|nr:hypothetical protein HA466_0006280 [Hirschfeldia incana]